jgi:hypothetical protein
MFNEFADLKKHYSEIRKRALELTQREDQDVFVEKAHGPVHGDRDSDTGAQIDAEHAHV